MSASDSDFGARDLEHMQIALDACRRSVDEGQSPFGACIARDGVVLACAHNEVWRRLDATAHAEVQAIRQACGEARSVRLEGATIYSTTEPCPMCFGAIHWAGIGRIVFGASIADAASFGFGELRISNRTLLEAGQSPIEVIEGCLREAALAELRRFVAGGGRTY